jgi:7-cyano-7-deazaguanine synthase
MKTLVLLSGGMDSATALGLSIHKTVNECGEPVRNVEAVSFNYGQRHSRELIAARNLVMYYGGLNHTIMDLRGAAMAFEGSALTGGGDVPLGHYADESMKKTVVPNRNMIMLSLAAGFAISRGIEQIVYAAHSGDHAIYPDCRPEFAAIVGAAIQIGNYNAPQLRTPFIDMPKDRIAFLGSSIGVPFDLTWSCYQGEDVHCGECGTCVERIEAFRLSGVPDPTEYANQVVFEEPEPTSAPRPKCGEPMGGGDACTRRYGHDGPHTGGWLRG